jgi:hypothetical protein
MGCKNRMPPSGATKVWPVLRLSLRGLRFANLRSRRTLFPIARPKTQRTGWQPTWLRLAYRQSRAVIAQAELGNAVLAAQAFHSDADLLVGGVVLAGGAADLRDHRLSWLFHWPLLLPHRLFLSEYDKPETFHSLTRLICLMGADGGQFR